MFMPDGIKTNFKQLFSLTNTTHPKLLVFSLIKIISWLLLTMALWSQLLKINKSGKIKRFLHPNFNRALTKHTINLFSTLKIVFASWENKLYHFCSILIKISLFGTVKTSQMTNLIWEFLSMMLTQPFLKTNHA